MQPAGMTFRRAFCFSGSVEMRVLKFGGTSVADGDAIDRVVAIIGGRPGPRVVVVSALAGVTDALLALAGTVVTDRAAAHAMLAALIARHTTLAAPVRDVFARQMLAHATGGIARGVARTLDAIADARAADAVSVDKLLAAGELWSSRILATRLADAGIPTQWLDARHVIRTDGRHRHAEPDRGATDRAVERTVRPSLASSSSAASSDPRLTARRRRSDAAVRTTRQRSSARVSLPMKSRSGPTSMACSRRILALSPTRASYRRCRTRMPRRSRCSVRKSCTRRRSSRRRPATSPCAC